MARKFIADSREHPDPDSNQSIEQVRDMMANFLPDLVNATWTTQEKDGDTIIEFQRRVGTKGIIHKFDMGMPVMTRNFTTRAEEAHGADGAAERIATVIFRHGTGDWGDLSENDRQTNEEALAEGGRLFSAYDDVFDFKVWVITEDDRSVTTILLPEDY